MEKHGSKTRGVRISEDFERLLAFLSGTSNMSSERSGGIPHAILSSVQTTFSKRKTPIPLVVSSFRPLRKYDICDRMAVIKRLDTAPEILNRRWNDQSGCLWQMLVVPGPSRLQAQKCISYDAHGQCYNHVEGPHFSSLKNTWMSVNYYRNGGLCHLHTESD